MLDSYRVKSTCFFLGYIARRFPNLVKEAAERGHEIASHGFYHTPIDKLNEKEFYDEVYNSKKLLEDISGLQVIGFRAPSFSVAESNPWFFEVLGEVGYKYDSSIFPAKSISRGGLQNAPIAPFKINFSWGFLVEFPITVFELLGFRFCFSGGGYLRFFFILVCKTVWGKSVARGSTFDFLYPSKRNRPRTSQT
ncbi:MAG: polysaccharide deacetylase family protein [Candidatus Kapaibacteriota bacterium]